jgi:hypothetical protein
MITEQWAIDSNLMLGQLSKRVFEISTPVCLYAVLTCADDGDTGDILVLVDTGQLDVGGVISDVHQGGVHHLVVDGVLGALTHTTSASIQIVNEQRAHLALLDDIGGL